MLPAGKPRRRRALDWALGLLASVSSLQRGGPQAAAAHSQRSTLPPRPTPSSLLKTYRSYRVGSTQLFGIVSLPSPSSNIPILS